METSTISEWERRKGMKADTFPSKHLPDDDDLETEPKITVDSDIQREYNSGLTEQENYMSGICQLLHLDL